MGASAKKTHNLFAECSVKEVKDQKFWCNLLDRITGKRNRQMRDAVNKAARLVIDHYLEYGIGTIVFGWNKGQKQRSEMGPKTNHTKSGC